jgi:hypothetical protein
LIQAEAIKRGINIKGMKKSQLIEEIRKKNSLYNLSGILIVSANMLSLKHIL